MTQRIDHNDIDGDEYTLRYRAATQGPNDAEGEESGWYTLTITRDSTDAMLHYWRDTPPNGERDHPSVETTVTALFDKAAKLLDAGNGKTVHDDTDQSMVADHFETFCEVYDMEGSAPAKYREFEHANKLAHRLKVQLGYTPEDIRTIAEQAHDHPLEDVEY